jgi:hypothetical protein
LSRWDTIVVDGEQNPEKIVEDIVSEIEPKRKRTESSLHRSSELLL